MVNKKRSIEENFKQSMSLVAPGTLAPPLQHRITCKIQNGRHWASKWLTGLEKGPSLGLLAATNHFR